MTVSLKGLVEENIVEINNKLGYTTCWLYNFKWVSDFGKFVNMLFTRSKSLSIILPYAREDKDVLMNTIRRIANDKNASVIILLTDKISTDNFLVCNKQN
ncbi:hypothetical protein EWF20_11330 [Sulfolobus sp. S-194]|uniref:DUF4898 domain-containing protein n=1 Tax=Sulfolobus sp. S-194 TaxID=2512240 RepID=UPI00143735DB|nr:DUF4898 domain-containing protein [Sulfolobus sp. S-194]QIW24666.1 hypothetical protein EWF20_11330 [Sulfolobus sp. S-194]